MRHNRRQPHSPSYLKLPIESLEPRLLLAAGTGLQGNYFNNADLTGYQLTRTDASISFNWGTGTPDPSIAAGTYSVRWAGQIQVPTTEAYTFYVTANDSVRLWIDGQRVIDHWASRATPSTDTASVSLVMGRRYDITLEYADIASASSVTLEWSSPTTARQVIPTQYLFPGKTGGLLREVWTGITGSTLTSLTSSAAYPNSPTTTTLYAPAESPTNSGDNYGERLRGYIAAPLTGDYTFYIASDDYSSLLLSNSTDPSAAQQIAYVSGYTNPRDWTKYTSQKSVTISLIANQQYYLEALHKEGTQSDNLAIGWTIPGSSTIDVIPSYLLTPLLPTVRIYQLQPKMNEGSTAPGQFQVVRSDANIGSALTVNYSVGGTATNGVDYNALSGSITIPAGATSAELDVTPLTDAIVEKQETVIISLQDQSSLNLGDISSQRSIGTIDDYTFAISTPGASAISATPLTSMNVWGTGTTSSVVSVTGPGFTQALQIITTTTPTNFWDIQAQLPSTIAVHNGDVMVLKFTARTTSGSGQLYADFEQAVSPYTHSLGQVCTFSTNWTAFQLPFTVTGDYAAAGAHLAFQLGYFPQTIQLGGISLIDYGQPASLLPTDSTTGWTQNGSASFTTVAVTGQSFAQAIQVQTTTATNSWDVQLVQTSTFAVSANETLVLDYWARSATAGSANVYAMFQLNSSPYPKSLSDTHTVGSTWTHIVLPFTVAADYASGTSAFGFFLGYNNQTVQIGGIRLIRNSLAPTAIATPPLPAFTLTGSSYGTLTSVTVSGTPTGFTDALEIQTTTKPATADLFRISQPSVSSQSSGDTMYLEFYARSTGAGNATFTAAVQAVASPFTASLSSTQTVGSTWTLFKLPFALAANYSAGQFLLAFNCGAAVQKLQIGAVHLTDISQAFAADVVPTITTPKTYGGRDAASAWRTTAQAAIVANREAPVSVTVLDQNGNPVNGVEVILRQKSQSYVFGNCGNASLIVNNNSTDAVTYRNILSSLFNTCVLENALKWPAWISDRATAIAAANWVVSNGLKLRGHNLIWPSRNNMPSSIWSQYDTINASSGAAAAAAWLQQTIAAHITDETTTLAGLPYQWDVVNEPYANHDVMDILGNAILIDWYNLAKAGDPNAKMVLNDYGIFDDHADTNHQANFENWISYLLSNGAALEGIGEQSHIGAQPPDIDQLQPIYDRYAKYGLPITVTEFDVNTTDEQIQADFLRDYFTFIFSQPSSNGILQWGFWQNSHWLPAAALFRSDWSVKPNGQEYEDLVFNDWWSDVHGTTANGGIFSTRAFKGTYDVIIQKNGTVLSTATVGDSGANITLTLDVTPPTVTSIVINDGSAQRSMVNSITVNFSEDVSVDAGAFSLIKLRSGSAAGLVTTPINAHSYLLTFSGTTGGSLADGTYRLTVNASAVHDLSSNPMAANASQKFHRLFGDINGDRMVNATDLAAFRSALGAAASSNGFFDYDASGSTIDHADYLQFRLRLQRRLL